MGNAAIKATSSHIIAATRRAVHIHRVYMLISVPQPQTTGVGVELYYVSVIQDYQATIAILGKTWHVSNIATAQ